MSLRPILDGVLVRLEAPPERIGSIHVPETSRDVLKGRSLGMMKIGVVLAVGPGRYTRKLDRKPDAQNTPRTYDHGSEGAHVPMTVRVGDRVLFDPLAELRPVMVDGEALHCGAEFQIAGILS